MNRDDVIHLSVDGDMSPKAAESGDVAAAFLATLAAGAADILLLEKTLTKAVVDHECLVTFLRELDQLVNEASAERDAAVPFLMGKYGVSMMTRLLLMIDDQTEWGAVASFSLDSIRSGLKSYSFDKLMAVLQSESVADFARQAHAKVLLTMSQKDTLADAFWRKYPSDDGGAADAMTAVFATADISVDLDLKLAVMRQYAKTAAGVNLLLSYAGKIFIPDVVLMGLSHQVLVYPGVSFSAACQWICGENGAGILKAMYVKNAKDACRFVTMLAKDQDVRKGVSGYQALIAIGLGLIAAMGQGLDQGVGTRQLVRDIVVATSPTPGTGPVSEALLQQTIEAGYIFGEALSEQALLNGLGKPVTLGELLERLVIVGQVIRISKEPLLYNVIMTDSFVPVLEDLVIERYGVSEGVAPGVAKSVVTRLKARPRYDAMVSFMTTELNLLPQGGGHVWVEHASAESINPFLTLLHQRLEAVSNQVPSRVIGSAGKERYEKIEKKVQVQRLSKALQETYVATFAGFREGKLSFADMLRTLERS